MRNEGKKGKRQKREEEGEEDKDEAKTTVGLHHRRIGLPGLLVLFVESHFSLLCSKHHLYLMRPLQSPEKRDAGNSSVPPPSHVCLLATQILLFFHNSHSLLSSFPHFPGLSLDISLVIFIEQLSPSAESVIFQWV